MNSANKMVWSIIAAASIATGSYFGTMSLSSQHALGDTASQTAKQTTTPQPETVAPANELSRAFRSVHNALKDAVVNINITKKVALSGGAAQIPPEFRRMLPPGFNFGPGNDGNQGNQDDGNGNGNDQPSAQMRGTGSGVIVTADGYILTNNHVVDGADTITVKLDDGREIKAKVVGTDPKTDLAVVKINADHLTYAKFGDSDAMQVGDWVLAFGSPFTFEETMTQGIISAKGRQVPIIEEHNPALAGLTYENFLQTDAAINPGNSGGPLVNLKGEVIGINTAIASSTGAYNGIGFSIPSNEARYIMQSLIKNGKVVRGYLGVYIEDINHPAPQDEGLVHSIRDAGFKGNEGILVTGSSPDSPGGKGGLQLGDVITKIDGKQVQSLNELRDKVARTAPGTDISLSIFRDGQTKDLTFPVGTQPATVNGARYASNNGPSAPGTANEKNLGLTVQDLDAQTARQYHVEQGKGVVVTQVAPTGAAAQLGLQPGDVVTRLNRKPVTSTDEFQKALAGVDLNKGVRMTVRTANGMDRLFFLKEGNQTSSAE